MMLLSLLYGDIFKKCLVEFVDGWRFKCTEFHPKCRQSASDQYISCSRTFFLAADKDLLLRVSELEDAVIFLMLHYIFWLEYPACCNASALAILQQHVLKRSATEDGLVPVNSSSLWTNLRLLIKMI